LVKDPFDGQAYNRYTYGANNPLSFIDASGLQSTPPDEFGFTPPAPREIPVGTKCDANRCIDTIWTPSPAELDEYVRSASRAAGDDARRTATEAQYGRNPFANPGAPYSSTDGAKFGSFPAGKVGPLGELPSPGYSYPDYEPKGEVPFLGVRDPVFMLGGLVALPFLAAEAPGLLAGLALRAPQFALRGATIGVGAGALGRLGTTPAGSRVVQNSAAVLSHLFGRGVAGAQTVLAEIQFFGGRLIPPPGLTQQMLFQYRDLATNAIMAGKDTLGVQAMRLQIIDAALNLPFLK
jgi:hypothetical protein